MDDGRFQSTAALFKPSPGSVPGRGAMSSLPPNIVGPILQAGVQQHHAARQLGAAREVQDELSAGAVRRSQLAADTIGESSADLQVSTDAAGAGSQGRAFSDAAGTAEDQTPAQSGDVQRGADGQPHLDIEA
jgi:hypothetical protein